MLCGCRNIQKIIESSFFMTKRRFLSKPFGQSKFVLNSDESESSDDDDDKTLYPDTPEHGYFVIPEQQLYRQGTNIIQEKVVQTKEGDMHYEGPALQELSTRTIKLDDKDHQNLLKEFGVKDEKALMEKIPDYRLQEIFEQENAKFGQQVHEVCTLLKLEERSARDVCVIDVSEKSNFTNYMIVVSADTQRQLVSLCDQLVEHFKVKFPQVAFEVDGRSDENGWISMHSGAIIVHLMLDYNRYHYDIERLWAWENVKLEDQMKQGLLEFGLTQQEVDNLEWESLKDSRVIEKGDFDPQ
mmetsp:Transcript_9727/g.14662  ORF Transcript_9727/g.14662 Transcript_9727/m.14662 type:complete len:298 (-) Transcript_9727:38-931(-)